MVSGKRGDALMLGVQVKELLDGAPNGVAEALDVIAGFDEALVRGFARLDEGSTQALSSLAASVGGSPLAEPAAQAVAKLGTGALGPEQLSALAAARAALLGAVHDALVERFDSATGRSRAAYEEPANSVAAPSNIAAGSRSWLQELAITGWRGVDHDLVAAADPTLEALLAEPNLRRLAVLLDGFAAELRASCPVATMDRLPARRWADLWSRALLLSWRDTGTGGAGITGTGSSGADTAGAGIAETGSAGAGIAGAGIAGAGIDSGTTISGRLLILGVDIHEHATAVQAQIYGVLEPVGGERIRRVRISVSATKVDTIVGPAVWQLLGAYPRLLTALAEHRSLDLTDMPLTASGDMLWHEELAQTGDPAEPFTTARLQLTDALAPAVPPLDRDPVHIAEPVLLEGYRIADGVLELDGHTLTLELDRLPSSGPLTPALVAASAACIGLLRWDIGSRGHWTLRLLAVQSKVKGKLTEVHGGDWACGPTDAKVVKAQAKTGDAVAVLRERAGRLLRK